MKFLRSLNTSLFGWGSPVVFGVVRMVTGFLALVNFLMISIDFDAWFTERGFIPVWHATRWGSLVTESGWEVPRINFLAGVSNEGITIFVYALCCLACLTTCLGLWTRLSSILMFLLITTLHHRAGDILHSGDTLLRQMAFLVMIAPSGMACSIDRLIGLRKGTAPPEPAVVSIWPQRLMQFQVSVLYFTTVWHKWGGSHWRDGTATWFVPQLHEFDRFPTPAFMDQQPMVAITTYGTLLAELGIALLAYSKPLRKWVLIAGVILHAGIEYRFNIPLFSMVMTSTYLAFYDGEEISAWTKKVGEKWSKLRATVLLPSGMELTPKAATFLKAVDPFGLLTYVTGPSDWSALDASGKSKNPFQVSLLRSPGAYGFALIPGAWKRFLQKSVVSIGRAVTTDMANEVVKS